MNKINFIFDNFYKKIPIPNGITVEEYEKNLTHEPFKPFILQIKESDLKSNYNEIFNMSYLENDIYYIFRYKDIIVKASDKIDKDFKNFYLINSRNHLSDIEPYLEIYQKRLEEGHTLLFVSIHEMGDYPKFKEWVNNNKFKNNIVIVAPSYNMRRFYECKVVFFPFFLFDPGKDFRFNAENENWNVCTKEEYLNTPKEAMFVSWNRNVRRMHRLLFYQFLSSESQLNKNFVSFIDFPPSDYYDNFLDRDDFLNKDYLRQFKTLGDKDKRYDIDLKGIPSEEVQNKLTNRFNVPDVYKKSYFSIVTETNYFEQETIITEKVLRPIANFHPFIIIGSEFIHSELKKFGYEIPNLINYEKIDSILNPHLRLATTFDELRLLFNNFEFNKKFCNLYVEQLEHNQNLLLNYDKNDAFYYLYDKLIKLNI